MADVTLTDLATSQARNKPDQKPQGQPKPEAPRRCPPALPGPARRPAAPHPPAGSWAAAGAGQPCRFSPRPPGRAAGRGAETAVNTSRQDRRAGSRPRRRRGPVRHPSRPARGGDATSCDHGAWRRGACCCCYGDGARTVTLPRWPRCGPAAARGAFGEIRLLS